MTNIIEKKHHYIYLAGSISADDETYKWREEFRELTKDLPVVCLDPTLNQFNQKLRRFQSSANLAKAAKERSQRILRPKDYQLIKIASVVVVNLALSDPDKPMIGTIQELVWAHDIFYVPVIGLTMGVDNPYTRNIWIDECCSAKVETVKDAVEMLQTLFLEF